MTRQEYKQRFEEITKWARKEIEKIDRSSKIIGLDTNKDKYKEIHKEYKNKLDELKKEFNN